jgi:hypothetical protein
LTRDAPGLETWSLSPGYDTEAALKAALPDPSDAPLLESLGTLVTNVVLLKDNDGDDSHFHPRIDMAKVCLCVACSRVCVSVIA